MTSEDFDRIASLMNNLGSTFDDEFVFLTRIIQSRPDESESNLVMDVLNDLADMQWETYEVLPEVIRRNLGDVIVEVWDKNSLDSTEKLVAVIAKLGLTSALSYLFDASADIVNPEVRNEIASAIIEFGDNIDDPYSGMK